MTTDISPYVNAIVVASCIQIIYIEKYMNILLRVILCGFNIVVGIEAYVLKVYLIYL